MKQFFFGFSILCCSLAAAGQELRTEELASAWVKLPEISSAAVVATPEPRRNPRPRTTRARTTAAAPPVRKPAATAPPSPAPAGGFGNANKKVGRFKKGG